VFRFAPSPNGRLHLGHAYAALVNYRMAQSVGGRFLLRIEDIDTVRCTAANIEQMLDDLAWLGLEWEEPVRRQSAHFTLYRSFLERLTDADLVYKSWLSRSDIARIVAFHEEQGTPWPRDPDGAALFPGRAHEALDGDGDFAWRLDMEQAIAMCGGALYWNETGQGPDGESGRIAADPSCWGDVVLVRKDTPASYHLAVVIDDALQGVTHVVRGFDLFAATGVHVLLQSLFGFPQPVYHHHGLITDDTGAKLSKSRGDTSIAALRMAGCQRDDVLRMIGLAP